MMQFPLQKKILINDKTNRDRSDAGGGGGGGGGSGVVLFIVLNRVLTL